jgi:hypothetical protein
LEWLYKFERETIAKTATEIISENSDLFNTIKKHEIIFENAFKELVGIISYVRPLPKPNSRQLFEIFPFFLQRKCSKYTKYFCVFRFQKIRKNFQKFIGSGLERSLF